jgi:small nuclear ribonucleoprotein (snRNP)-like protein
MSKRLIRIKGTDACSKLAGLSDTEINVVLRNGVTYFGKLQQINQNEVIIRDAREHIHILKTESVHEIVLDTTAKLEDITNK